MGHFNIFCSGRAGHHHEERRHPTSTTSPTHPNPFLLERLTPEGCWWGRARSARHPDRLNKNLFRRSGGPWGPEAGGGRCVFAPHCGVPKAPRQGSNDGEGRGRRRPGTRSPAGTLKPPFFAPVREKPHNSPACRGIMATHQPATAAYERRGSYRR